MQEILEKKNEFLKPHQNNQNTESSKNVEKHENSFDELKNIQNAENKSGEISIDDIGVQDKSRIDDDLLQIPAFLRRQAN